MITTSVMKELKRIVLRLLINPFYATGLFLYPLKTKNKKTVVLGYDRGYGKRLVT